MTSLEQGHTDGKPTLIVLQPMQEQIVEFSRLMNVDRQMLITEERDGYVGLQAKLAPDCFQKFCSHEGRHYAFVKISFQ